MINVRVLRSHSFLLAVAAEEALQGRWTSSADVYVCERGRAGGSCVNVCRRAEERRQEENGTLLLPWEDQTTFIFIFAPSVLFVSTCSVWMRFLGVLLRPVLVFQCLCVSLCLWGWAMEGLNSLLSAQAQYSTGDGAACLPLLLPPGWWVTMMWRDFCPPPPPHPHPLFSVSPSLSFCASPPPHTLLCWWKTALFHCWVRHCRSPSGTTWRPRGPKLHHLSREGPQLEVSAGASVTPHTPQSHTYLFLFYLVHLHTLTRFLSGTRWTSLPWEFFSS